MMIKSPRALMALQITAGVVVVLVVYAVSLWLLQNDQLVVDPADLRPPKQTLRVLDGYAETTALMNKSWSTINPDAFNFAGIKRSFNRKGGAQFSYSLWIRLRDTSAPNVAGKTILMRGDPKVYTWRREPTQGTSGSTAAEFRDVLIACPRIAFGATFDALDISVNTVAEPLVAFAIRPRVEDGIDANKTGLDPPAGASPSDPSLRHNALKLIQNRWALLSFVFEDHVAISDFEDGISVRFYINDALYANFRTPNALKQNNGDFILFPSIRAGKEAGGGIRDATVGNVTYHNYALSTEDCTRIFQDGPPTYAAKNIAGGGMGEPLFLTEYNKLDIYNT
jgi:hypothetical protein